MRRWCLILKKYIKDKEKYAIVECKYAMKTWREEFFYLYCGICGARNGEIPVDELCEEEGFPDGDYCRNCQESMREQGLVGEDKSVYFLKKDNSHKEKRG
jgi:hypothetical protein